MVKMLWCALTLLNKKKTTRESLALNCGDLALYYKRRLSAWLYILQPNNQIGETTFGSWSMINYGHCCRVHPYKAPCNNVLLRTNVCCALPFTIYLIPLAVDSFYDKITRFLFNSVTFLTCTNCLSTI